METKGVENWTSNRNGRHERVLAVVRSATVYTVRDMSGSRRVLVCVCMCVSVCEHVAVKCLFVMLPVCSCNSVSCILLYLVAVYVKIYEQPSVICYLCKEEASSTFSPVLHSKHFVCIQPVGDRTGVTSNNNGFELDWHTHTHTHTHTPIASVDVDKRVWVPLVETDTAESCST